MKILINSKKLLRELYKFGLVEVLYRILYSLNHDEMVFTKACMIQKKYYEGMNVKQLEKELGYIYKINMSSTVNFVNPVTFTEKIQWIKLHDDFTLKTKLADKLVVRDWIKDKIGEEYLVPLLGDWSSYESIDFKSLPKSFCLKMNHGSGMNYVVKDKDSADYEDMKRKFSAWINRPFEVTSLELHYTKIPKRIIAEKCIEELTGNLYDYKIHCFNGTPVFIQCIGNRNLKNHTGMQNNYDLNWNKLDWIFEDYPKFSYEVVRPKRLDEMIEVASKLSKGFSYVRVDLYDLDNKVLFGEMTFSPGSGMYPYKGTWTKEKDIEIGKLVKLQQKIKS